MKKEHDEASSEENVIKFLKKNKNFLIKFPELLNDLRFPLKDNSSEKVVDLDIYRYKKISQENIDLQNQMTQILLAGKSHINTQKRILKSSVKILNSKTIDKVINVILVDFKTLLGCDIVNCYSTDNTFKISNVHKIDNKIAQSYFKDKAVTNLNQSTKGILLYFPNNPKIIESYILLKVSIGDKFLVIAIGSKNKKKFSSDQQVDLVEYLVKILEIKIKKELL